VYIDQAVLIVVDKSITQYPHEPGKDDQVRIQRIDDLHHRSIKRFPVGVFFMVNNVGFYICLAGTFQTRRCRRIADYRFYLSMQIVVFYRVDYRLQVAATTGDEYDKRSFWHG
jgi:hypothetical protein